MNAVEMLHIVSAMILSLAAAWAMMRLKSALLQKSYSM